MKATPIFVAAASLAMLGACRVQTEDNSSTDAAANSSVAAGEGVGAATNAAGADTLGNQLNQLQQSDSSEENASTNTAD